METKSLILGLSLSLGVFALKSGAGLSYVMRRGGGLKAAILFAAGYVPVFWAASVVSGRLGLGAYIEGAALLSENGMALHLLLAALLLAWGVGLLKGCGRSGGKSRGWLLFALPCPVCFLVIILSGAVMDGLAPGIPRPFAWMYAGFVTTGLACALFLSSVTRRLSPEHGLGVVMLLASLYFILTVTVAPQIGDAKRVYRLGREASPAEPDSRRYIIPGAAGLAFAAGFAWTTRRLRWK